MLNWKNISLYQFQQVDKINSRQDIDDLDKMLFVVCVVYGYTEHQVNEMAPKKASKLISEVSRLFQTQPAPAYTWRHGRYLISTNPDKLTFGQYVELAFFIRNKIQHAHYILASLSRLPFRTYDSSTHRKRAAAFETIPIEQALGIINQFADKWGKFNGEYKALFEQDGESITNKDMASFNDRYGWIYSASVLAEYQRIPLDDVYKLSARQALNALAYLKAKRKYDDLLSKIT